MKEINKNITDLLVRSYGIDVSKYAESFLNKSLQKRITETHCRSAEEYCTFLEQNNEEGKNFFDSLHISYSEFFRNTITFAVLEHIVLPDMVLQKKNNRRKEIRIWSAASAAGQESYCLAMLLEELKNGDSNKFSYRIFATDQDESQVNEARKGQFSLAALNNMNLKRVNQWFTKHGETYTVKPELKENIDFSVFDLVSENLSYPSGSIYGNFDLVVCANILFYYNSEYRKIILEKTSNALANGGFLITSETERDILLRHNYQEVVPQSAIFRIK